jgi:hypothetical protein
MIRLLAVDLVRTLKAEANPQASANPGFLGFRSNLMPDMPS